MSKTFYTSVLFWENMQQLTQLNTFGLTSVAEHYISINSLEQLEQLPTLLKQHQAFFILGGGSNVVLAQQVQGLVIHNQLKGVELIEQSADDYIVQAYGGEVWHEFVQYCIQHGWNGLENLALIPGSVGAAPVQNIGAYGLEVKDFFDSLRAFNVRTGEWRDFSREECRFAYRDSVFKHEAKDFMIVSIRMRLPKSWHARMAYADLKNYAGLHEQSCAQDIFNAVCAIRQAKLPDPKVLGNAGSFFKNPIVSASQYQQLKVNYPELVAYAQEDGRYKLAAGWLIDQCGWKGRDLGLACVHTRQALVLVNRGGACAQDIQQLAQAIQADVKLRYGVQLEPEPIFVS